MKNNRGWLTKIPLVSEEDEVYSALITDKYNCKYTVPLLVHQSLRTPRSPSDEGRPKATDEETRKRTVWRETSAGSGQ